MIEWSKIPYYAKQRAKDFGDLEEQRDWVAHLYAPHDLWPAAWERLTSDRQKEILTKIADEMQEALLKINILTNP